MLSANARHFRLDLSVLTLRLGECLEQRTHVAIRFDLSLPR
jgi:hypothetical protein